MEFWQQVAERNGPWALFLLIVCVAVYKWGIPYMRRQEERLEAANKATVDALAAAVEESRKSRSEEVAKFVQTMTIIDARNAATQHEAVDAIRALTEEIRRGGKRARD